MTIKTHYLPHLALVCLLATLLFGCGGSRQPVIYYNLTPLAAEGHDQGPAGQTEHPLAIGVGPIALPEALSRAQIASRLDDQRLRYDDYNRWSGSLAADFADVLLADIAAQLPLQATVAPFPWGAYFQPSHRLVVDVSRFDGALQGEVVLKARWTITNATGKETLVARQSTIKVKVAGAQYQDLVTAQSQALADLSAEIVAALAAR